MRSRGLSLAAILVAALAACSSNDGSISVNPPGPPPGPPGPRGQRAGVAHVLPRCTAHGGEQRHNACSQSHHLAGTCGPGADLRQRPIPADALRIADHLVDNTVLLPVKTTAQGAFRIEARSGYNGALQWNATSDYVVPPHNWFPSFNLTLTANDRLYAPGAEGKLLYRDDVDLAAGTLQTAVFYGATSMPPRRRSWITPSWSARRSRWMRSATPGWGFFVTGANSAALRASSRGWRRTLVERGKRPACSPMTRTSIVSR